MRSKMGRLSFLQGLRGAVIAAALAAGVLIWLISATNIDPPTSLDPNARPSAEQPIAPPAPVPTTVALKLTLSPNVDGLRLDETVVSVLRLLTV